jgi:Raf kinase inhibitor-like YbhB/YbcL family protein
MSWQEKINAALDARRAADALRRRYPVAQGAGRWLVADDVPAGTKSFVVTCYDPDAPTGSGWWHWVVVNLPADTRVLPQGFGSGLVAMPDGVLQTRTDFGKTGYDGAAPPKGETHRYIFTVHALDVERIDVDEGASGAMVGFNVHFHSLASASITAMFS